MKKNLLFGIDLGGSSIKMAIIKSNGEIVKHWYIKTDTSNAGHNIISSITVSFKNMCDEHNIPHASFIGCGIGVPAPVIENSGYFPTAVNLGGFGEIEISTILSSELGMEVVAGNDANVAAIGELWIGAAVGLSNAIMITLGTGVGGGVIINNSIVYGQNGAAGEIGHMPSVIDKESKDYFRCNCGANGCLETVASARGIEKLFSVRKDEFPNATLATLKKVTTKEIFDYAKKGDQLALDVVDAFSKYIATAIKQICAVVNPEVILIGGGVSNAGNIIIESIYKNVKKDAFPILVHDLKIENAVLGNNAGVIGGAYLALRKFGENNA